MCPIITCGDKNVEVAAIGVAVGSALESCPLGIITAWTSTDSRIQIETISKYRSIDADFSAIDVDIATSVGIATLVCA